MKNTLKLISTSSIIIFGILWILSKFEVLPEYNSPDIRNIFILIYLFTSLKYFQLEVKDKNAEIEALKSQLEKTDS